MNVIYHNMHQRRRGQTKFLLPKDSLEREYVARFSGETPGFWF